MGAFERFKRRPLLSDWVKLEDYIREDMRLLTGQGVYAAYEVEGRFADTANLADLFRWAGALNNTWRNAVDDRLTIKIKINRSFARPETWPITSCNIPFVADLLAGYRETLLDRALYENRMFICLEYAASRPGGVAKHMAKMGQRLNPDETLEERVDALSRVCARLEADLSDYGLRRLGFAERRGIQFDEIAEADALVQTGMHREVPVTDGRPGDVLLSEDVTFHHEHIEIRHPGSTTYAAHLGWKEFPAATYPGILNNLLAAPFRFSLVQSFRPMEQSEGQDIVRRKQNRMVWARDRAASQVASLDMAADDLLSGAYVMGDYNVTLCAFSDRAGTGSALVDRMLMHCRDLVGRKGLPAWATDVFQTAIENVVGRAGSNPLSDVVNMAWKYLAQCGCVVARENRALAGAWLSMLPGNDKYRPRPGAITSVNFADFAPLHGYSKGPVETRWGEAIAITVSPAGTAHRFHWHDGPGDGAVGNTLITGETGSGKTLGTGFFIAHTLARIWNASGGWIGCDHKRGWNALTLACGGNYSIMGDQQPFGAPMKALSDTARTREFLTELLRGCIMWGGWRDLTPEEDHRLALGIKTVMRNAPEDRWIGEVQAFLGDDPDGAGARLRRWCWGEELGWVIDAPQCSIDMDGDINCFDTTHIMANKRARGPALLYLFFRIEQRLNGKPLLVSVDEGWFVVMEDEVFKPAMQKIARTIRSKNGILVFITQSPGDVVRAGMAAEMVEQFPNQHHYANQRVSEAEFCSGLRRTKGEFDALMRLRKGQGSFLLCKGNVSSVQTTPLHGLDDFIAILSASQENLEAIDEMTDEQRADPIEFQRQFHARRKVIAERNRRMRNRTRNMEHAA